MKIIYLNDTGFLCIVHPTKSALDHMTIQEIAEKDVPTGKKFKIINEIDLPTDPTYRDAWTIDEALLTDGVGL
ncbi:TPA: hypothetical protein RP379_001181 [Acinetobacter baumannii]|uniref:Uncharacterized protein n=1 Tax=Acinetobacter baumannii NIPH 80 TaxID=1217629 RepID=N9JQ29_ACIBA|nr:hypothetical protein [Acinetobacter baumannii]ENW73843.1 hypothetical protein F913_01227 [Acinetobacter baumannii NIPH 80]HCQ9571717.1 hypothetical protein [Acinetobacter baumannii]HDX5995796.1 hypothetical protein [Acinetobacter baumannii]